MCILPQSFLIKKIIKIVKHRLKDGQTCDRASKISNVESK